MRNDNDCNILEEDELTIQVIMLIFNNFLIVVILIYKGPEKLKEEIKQAKQRRIDAEIAWDFERDRIQQELNAQDKLRRDRLVGEDPVDLIGMTAQDPVIQELVDKQTAADQYAAIGKQDLQSKDKKKKKKRGKKGKGQDDEVSDIMFGTVNQSELAEDTGFDDPAPKGNKIKKPKKKRRDKLKGQQDEVGHIEMVKSKSSFKSKVGDDFNTIGPPEDDFYIDDGAKPQKQETMKSKKSFRTSKSKMHSSKLSDLIQPPVEAPGDEEFIIESGVPEDADELAGKKTKSSSDKQNIPESSSSEKKKKDKKKKKKRKSQLPDDDNTNADEDQREDQL